MRLLLVENNAVFASVVIRQFLHGHEATLTPSLADARRQLQEGGFEAVLVDFDLDDGSGDVLVRELVAGGFRGCIIAISSHTQGNAALVAAGARAACPKGGFQEIAALLERVAAQLRRQPAPERY